MKRSESFEHTSRSSEVDLEIDMIIITRVVKSTNYDRYKDDDSMEYSNNISCIYCETHFFIMFKNIFR